MRLTLEQEIAFSDVLIDCGVPEKEADEITDCVASDPWEDIENATLASIGCWTSRPEVALRAAFTAADEALASAA